MNNNKGFTLIELLVVIAIIGVLSSIVLVSMGGARVDARNTARKSDMRQLITAQEMHYGTHEAYESAAGKADGTQPIPGYLDELDEGKSTHTNYVWLANDAAAATACSGTEGEFFCAYATAEGVTNTWYASSEKGTKTVTVLPAYGATDCECW